MRTRVKQHRSGTSQIRRSLLATLGLG